MVQNKTHSWSLPGDSPNFVRIWSELFVAQGGHQRLEAFILKQLTSFQTAPFQLLKVLVQVFYSLRVGSNSLGFLAALLKLDGDARHVGSSFTCLLLSVRVSLLCMVRQVLCHMCTPSVFPHPSFFTSESFLQAHLGAFYSASDLVSPQKKSSPHMQVL